MTDRPTFDLQSHSTHSDGALAPAEVVEAAADAGVRLLALTDHDTVSGVDEAARKAAELDVELVPAAELSALQGDYEDFRRFIYALETAPQFLIIDDLVLTQANPNDPLTLIISMSTYFRLSNDAR